MEEPSGATGVIERLFAERFAHWEFRLPSEAVSGRQPGRIMERGWHVAWIWGEDDGEQYLEVFCQHRMTTDDHFRIWASERVDRLPAPTSMQLLAPDATPEERAADKRAFFDQNRRRYAELREKGLLPPPGTNAMVQVPAHIETELIARAPIDVFPDYELRCIAVRIPTGAPAQPFRDGWPAPTEAES